MFVDQEAFHLFSLERSASSGNKEWFEKFEWVTLFHLIPHSREESYYCRHVFLFGSTQNRPHPCKALQITVPDCTVQNKRQHCPADDTGC